MPELAALSAIADHLANEVEDKDFDLGIWHQIPSGMNCKTVRCAVGHSYELPEVIATGLTYDEVFTPVCYVGNRELSQFDAISHCFGLSENDARQLFHPYRYGNDSSRCTVVKRIREFVRTHETKPESP